MSSELTISQRHIENRIFNIRNVQVMLDSDLAQIYQVETKMLNRAVKRNLERFPEDFMFQLTEYEWDKFKGQIVALGHSISQNEITNEEDALKYQIGTLKQGRGQHRKYLPFVFTEQGVAGLSGVLKSMTAAKVHVTIMRAFVAMRKFIQENQLVYQRLDKIELRQLETDQKFEKVFKALESRNIIPNQGVFFDGQVFDAYELASKIIRSAKTSIVLIDNYIDESTLTHLSKKNQGVKALLLTQSQSKQLNLDLQKANEQYGNFELKHFEKSHDRFLIIDGQEVYHLGASLKDLGKKWFAFSHLDKNSVQGILHSISGLV
jgi:hypothetical protein